MGTSANCGCPKYKCLGKPNCRLPGGWNEQAPITRRKVTIAELEKLLDDPREMHIHLLPDGSITALDYRQIDKPKVNVLTVDEALASAADVPTKAQEDAVMIALLSIKAVYLSEGGNPQLPLRQVSIADLRNICRAVAQSPEQAPAADEARELLREATQAIRSPPPRGIEGLEYIDDLLTRLHAYLAHAPQADAGKVRVLGLDTDTQVCFYERDFYMLSNFSAFNVEWCGLKYQTSEHAYQWAKFGTGNGDRFIAAKIMDARSAHDAFKLAEQHVGSRRTDWNRVKLGFMKDILIQKAVQHEYVLRKLLATGERTLIEDSWRDNYWGWGPNRDGVNMLGKLWMEVRAELRAAAPPTGE